MDIRHITPDYAVSPQISAEDIPAIAEAGFTTIICNRPDAEVPPSHQAAAIEAAAKAAGISFTVNPVTHQTLNMDMVTAQMAAAENSSGPVLAYCASGTRSSIVWSLGQAGQMLTDAIIEATAKAGYDLAGMRGQLDGLAKPQ
ncbi:MAG: TIGR01244 family phosphatase [Loktanella sp.]|nr:TIGR01244 family phosphatase [Loktanella sp.]